jgi:hypothetical protein
MEGENKVLCPCCGLGYVDAGHQNDVCDVCYWEDDPVQFRDPDYRGGANKLSLNEARKEYDTKRKVA